MKIMVFQEIFVNFVYFIQMPFHGLCKAQINDTHIRGTHTAALYVFIGGKPFEKGFL